MQYSSRVLYDLDQPANPDPPLPPAADDLLKVGGFASEHIAGVNFLFGDGSVHSIGKTIAAETFQHLANRADGKLIEAGDF